MIKYKLIISGMILGISNLANANCGIVISSSNVAITWDQSFNFIPITFIVQKNNPEACNVRLGFTKGQSSDYNRYSSFGVQKFNYQIFSDSSLNSVLKDGIDVISGSDTINLSFPFGSNLSQTITYYFQISQYLAVNPTYKMAGIYSDFFNIKAYDSNPLISPIASSNVNVIISVPKLVQLSIVDSNEAFNQSNTSKTINFGELKESKIANFGIRVRTNSGFSLFATSTNSGKLKHTTFNDSVAYSFNVNSVNFNLTNVPTLVAQGNGQTSVNGNLNNIRISTSPILTERSGDYTDSISLSVQSNE